LRTQFASLPSIDTRYRPPWYSATTTGNDTSRPVRRPGTSSVIARAGDNIPAENWTAEIRFATRATAPGRPVRYIHRFTQYNR
jgi:hypothetical protein